MCHVPLPAHLLQIVSAFHFCMVLMHAHHVARYDCKGGCWISSRDGHDMHERLEAELSDVLGPLELEPPPAAQQGWVGYGADPT